MLEKEIATDWPTPQDYNEAIQNPRACFSDPDLKDAKIALNALGLPHAASGAFASVYKATAGETSWAVRCFLNDRPEQKTRYKQISDFVLFENLDATVDFFYLDKGIKVRGNWYPCLKMNWVDGPTLDRYIDKNHADTNKMTALLKSFHQLVGELEGAGISHGDLQHGNIIVTDAGLRLVDYDALFVPALAGLKSLEYGHPNYQHPLRTADHFDPKTDNFSCWLIHASILCIAIDPSLYKTLDGGDECILFRRTDLRAPAASPVFNALLNHDSEHIKETVELLKRMLSAAPNTIPYLGAPPEELAKLSTELDGVSRSSKSDGVSKAGEAPTSSERYGTMEETESAVVSCIADELTKLETPGDLSSIYDAIDTSLQNRQKQKRNPGTQLKKLTENTFKAGRQARDRIQKVADKLELSTIPSNWIARKLKEASEYYFAGRYDEASKVYLGVFKQLDQNRHELILSEVAISLGYCFGLEGRPSLAANYFLLFLNEGKRRYENSRSRDELTSDEIRDAAFLLALCKFDDGNENAAIKVLTDYQAHIVELTEMIDQEQGNAYIYRWNSFRMLAAAALRSAQKPNTDSELTADLINGAALIFMRLLVEHSSSCTEELIDSYMRLISGLLKLQLPRVQERAKQLFTALADACADQGFKHQAKVASFCRAVLQNATDKQQDAMVTIASLGSTDVDEFTKIATAAGDYLKPDSILKLLENIVQFFTQLNAESEARDALRVACRFAPHCTADLRHLIDTLDTVDEKMIRMYLEESYFAPTCPARVRDEFVLRLADQPRPQILAAALSLLITRESKSRVANLILKVAERAEPRILTSALIAASKQFPPVHREKHTSTDEKLTSTDEIINRAIETALENLKKASSPRDPDKISSFAWSHYYAQLSALDSLHFYYNAIGNREKADELLGHITAEQYQEIVTSWFFNLLRTAGFERYYSFILTLVVNRKLDLLERIVSTIVSNGHITILDGILKSLISAGQLSFVFELAVRLAENGKLVAFANVSSEITKAATQNQILDFVDVVSSRRKDGATYTASVIAHLIKQHQTQKASRVLVHLHDAGKLTAVSFDFQDLLNTPLPQSIFAHLLHQKEFGTLAEITCAVACAMNLNGLRRLFKLLQLNPTLEQGLQITEKAFEQCCAKLDSLLTLPALFEQVEIIGPDLQLALRELHAAMEALHKLRDLIGADCLKRLIEQSTNNCFARSISARYDPLVAAWVMDLARHREFVLINSVGRELAQQQRNSAIAQLVTRFTCEGQQEALYNLTANFILTDCVKVALDIAFQLAKYHTFEAKTILAQIIRHGNHDELIIPLIECCVEKNEKLADLMVRHLAYADKEDVFKPMAKTFLAGKNKTALNMVLTQLLSMDHHFLPFVKEMCETNDAEQIDMLGEWLKNNGMSSVICERIDQLRVFNLIAEADRWEKYLPQDT